MKLIIALATVSSAAEISPSVQRNIDWHCEKTHSENCIRYDTVVPQYHFFGTTYQEGKYGSPEKCAAHANERYFTQWCPKRELVCDPGKNRCLVHDRWSGDIDYLDRDEYSCLRIGWADDFCNGAGDRCFDDYWSHYCPDLVSTDVPDTPYGGCSSAGVVEGQENEMMCESQCLATPGCSHWTFRDGAPTGTGDGSKGRPGSEGKCYLCRDATSDGVPCSLEENGCRYASVPASDDVAAVEDALAKADEVCASDGNDMDAPVRLTVVRAAARLSSLVKRVLSNQHFDAAALAAPLVDRVAARLASGYDNCEEREEYDDENVGGWECSGGAALWTTLQAFMVAADSEDGTLVGARAFPTLEDKGRQRLLEEHRVFLADDHYFGREWNTRGLAINTIESFFANLPDHLKDEGVLGAGEPFLTLRIPSAFECKSTWVHSGNHDSEYFDIRGHGAGQADLLKFTSGHNGDAGNPWRAVVDVRKFDWGEGTDNAFEGTSHEDACDGDTVSDGCAGDRLLYDLREGVSRLFEEAYTYRQRRLRHRINNRVSGDEHWLRQVVPGVTSGPHAHMTSDVQKILPLQLGGQYLKSSHTQLLIAKAAAEAGNLWPLQWFLLDVDVVGRTGTDSVPQPTAAPTSSFPTCGVRINLGNGAGFHCETDPAATEHAGKKIAFACCDADMGYSTCTRADADGQCYAGFLRPVSNFAPKDWHEATNVCAAEGKVLCGVDQPCQNRGCHYNGHYQWTGEECQAGDAGLPAACASVFYEEDSQTHQVAALTVGVERSDKFGHDKADGMIRHLKIPGCGVWSFTYNVKEILKAYTATADPIYGDPAVCAPPVIQHVDDGTRNIHGHCGRDYRDQVLCGVYLSKP